MVGMESGEFAKGRSVIANIHLMKEYRETADPVYPGVAGSSYAEVFESIGVHRCQAHRRGGLPVHEHGHVRGAPGRLPGCRDRERRQHHDAAAGQ